MLELIFKRHFPGLVYDHNCYDSEKRIFTMEVYDDLPILHVALFNLELRNLNIEFVGKLFDTSF